MKRIHHAKKHLITLMRVGFAVLLYSFKVNADITFDKSSVVSIAMQGKTLTGNMNIRADDGTLMGNNLFHSFDKFNINTGQSAIFTTDNLHSAIHNVIARVTGNGNSTINGLLVSTIPNANFYLFNPNGIIFGKDAQLDVQGTFHASTASILNFKDNSHFSATINNEILTAAPIQSFGFLENSALNNGTITINGSQLNQTNTAIKTVDLVAGNINIENKAVITVPSGEIRLVAMQGAGAVSLVANSSNILVLPNIQPSNNNAGEITIKGDDINSKLERSKLITSGNGAGRVAMWGGDIVFKNARIFNDNEGNENALETNGKNIDIQASNLSVDNSLITTDANGLGSAANVHINATNDIAINNDGGIKSNVYSTGHAGQLFINSHSLNIDGQNTGISSKTINDSTGNASDIHINVEDTLNLTNNADISSFSLAQGKAGDIIAQANIINVSNGAKISSSTAGKGNAGNISLQTQEINILNASEISSSTTNKGNAGNIIIKIVKQLYIDGINKNDNTITPTGILSEAKQGSHGAGGIIIINALNDTNTPNISINNGGFISSTTYSDNHNTGDVLITTDKLSINKKDDVLQTGIFSNANQRKGNAGNISINTRTLEMNGGEILANTFAQGNAGSTIISVKQNALLNNKSRINSFASGLGGISGTGGTGGKVIFNSPLLTLNNHSEISATSNTSNKSGDININTNSFNLRNHSEITAKNTGTGKAGAINITAQNLAFIENNSKITVASNQGDAGDIAINTPNTLYLLNSEITTSAADGKGNGGNISIGVAGNSAILNNLFNPTFVILNNSSIVANALRGNGGKIDILTRYFLQSTNSIVQASSQFGLQGNISINSANANIAGSISVLNASFMDDSKLIQEDCNKRYAQNSSFVVRSGNMLLPSPDNRFDYIPTSLEGCTTSF